MKKIIQLTIYLGIIMLFLNNTVRAQPIIQNGTSTNYYGETNSTPVSQNDWVRRLGVGSFSLNFDEPHAFFHINSNYLLLPANGSITNFGEVFRTQSPTTLIQAWRMFTGGGSGTQIFNIKNDNTTGSNSISLETFQNDGAIIFNTSPNTERMRIYESTFSNTIGTADPGMVRVGFSSASTNPNGFGPLVHIPKLLVVGSEQNIVSAFADYTVAEFRSEFNESSSVGIKIRGSRYLLSNLCTAHLDFSNYDKDESGGSEYILARLCADMQSDAGELGYFHINTRDGVGVFNSKLLIDNIGFTGIGTTFFMSGAGVFNGPQRRLHVYDAADVPQFRISQAYDVTSSSAGVFTDFQVTSQGNLNMRGFSTGAAIANGQPYAGTVNDGRTGFNLSLATQPQNTVEINSGVTDVGGLRFTKLISTSATSSFSGVALSVDANGDVILVPAPGMCTSFSNASPVNYFSKWTGTGPNIICDSRMYEDNATKNVAVDWDGTAIDAKLRVKYISSNGTPNGISCKLTAGSGTGTAIGILSNVVGTSGATNYFGVRSVATGNTGSNLVYGVYGKAVGTTSTLGSPANFGVYGYATGGGIGQNVGVYGKVDVAGDWAGWFQGDVNVTGVGFIPGGVWSVSDKTIKTDIVPIENVDEILSQLTGYTYEFDNSIHPSLPLPKGEQIGVISQELALVLPQLVKRINLPAVYDTLGVMISDTFSVLSVNYEGLIPVLVEGYKSQQKKIEDLQSQIVGCCSTKMKTANDDGASPANQIVELKTAATNYLGQSVPNPHGSQCTIPYSIDANVTNAEIVFVDELGRVIQRVEIVTLGKGQLTVLSSNLEDGVYNYSLVLDNKIIDTKKMLKQH